MGFNVRPHRSLRCRLQMIGRTNTVKVCSHLSCPQYQCNIRSHYALWDCMLFSSNEIYEQAQKSRLPQLMVLCRSKGNPQHGPRFESFIQNGLGYAADRTLRRDLTCVTHCPGSELFRAAHTTRMDFAGASYSMRTVESALI